ncbi:hypothetical protein HanIR_Chr17g0871641 [Helianthus annuus]|nr:hypothetical protein HanIR_Chr17g0871641 [Helianthus annuus]
MKHTLKQGFGIVCYPAHGTTINLQQICIISPTVNHLIGSFRTSGIGVALSVPDGGCPANCCITCSGCSSTLLTIADACVMLTGEGSFTHLCLYVSLLNPTSTSEGMLCTCRNGFLKWPSHCTWRSSGKFVVTHWSFTISTRTFHQD